jgi:hypothetical protein
MWYTGMAMEVFGTSRVLYAQGITGAPGYASSLVCYAVRV